MEMDLGPSHEKHPARANFTGRDDFDILSQLQHSGTSEVYRVVSRRGRLKNRVMALKLQISSSQHGQALMHQSLHHPNVVTLFSFFGDLGSHAYLLEYCHGGNLRDYLENIGRPGLGHNELRSLVRSMASALLYLQGQRIIHRSVEPRNILISTTNLFKLHNFENAVYSCEGAQEPCENTSRYSAPELVAREPFSHSADTWSLGCVFLAACIGPFSVERPTERVEDLLPPEENPYFGQFQFFLANILKRVPSQRMTPIEVLSQDWIMPRSESDASLFDTRGCSAGEDKPSHSTPSGISAQFSGLGLGYPSNCRDAVAWKQVGRIARSSSEPIFKPQFSDERTYMGLRSFSESVDRERLIQFFMKPADSTRTRQPHLRNPDVGSWNATVSSTQRVNTGLSILPPKEYKVQRGSINILPSGSFTVDFRSTSQPADGLAAEEILLIDPSKEDVQIHAVPSRTTVCEAKLTKPRQQFPISELPEPHNTIYLEALALLEEIKQRTPMLTFHMVDGKCTMMCNYPLPDIEILLRVTPSIQAVPSRAMFRVRLFRRLQRLEFAQRTTNAKSSEWLKRIIPSTDNYPFVHAAELSSLDDLEKRGLHILRKFILVCDSALELGLNPSESSDGSFTLENLNEEPTFDSDFTPNFVPDLASSLPPRPLRKHRI